MLFLLISSLFNATYCVQLKECFYEKEEEIKVVLLYESVLLFGQGYFSEIVFFMEVPVVEKIF
jgi:hypothetical protein